MDPGEIVAATRLREGPEEARAKNEAGQSPCTAPLLPSRQVPQAKYFPGCPEAALQGTIFSVCVKDFCFML